VHTPQTPRYEFTFSDVEGATISRLKCDSSASYFTVAAYILLTLPLLCGAFLAVKTAKVKEEYSEALSIRVSLYCLVFVAVPLVLLQYILPADFVEIVYIDAFMIMAASTASVLAFYLPKLIKLRSELRQVQVVPEAMVGGGVAAVRDSRAEGKQFEMTSEEVEEELGQLRLQVVRLKESERELSHALSQKDALIVKLGSDGKLQEQYRSAAAVQAHARGRMARNQAGQRPKRASGSAMGSAPVRQARVSAADERDRRRSGTRQQDGAPPSTPPSPWPS